ncbi:peptidoglycan D,D-transpeptidase FtsI family protein [Desertibaculum subflavum]|uniref:peptidoglycan D,D-transpeptidase FtsI family protein n=1 Tax=Desertibaculum subflavum TaxID=2268458 RepID=UPI000E667AC9
MKVLFRKPRSRARPCTPADLRAAEPFVQLDGAVKHAVETGRNRVVIAAAVFGLCFLALAGRLADLMLFRGGIESSPTRTAGLSAAVEQLPAVKRAPIVDRNGVLLAVNLRSVALAADPRKLMDPREAATKLARLFPELNRARLEEELRSDKGFVYVRRNLAPAEQQAVNRLGIPGLSFHPEEKRVYPQGSLAVHAVGYTDIDGKGIAGAEQALDQRLRDPARMQEPVRLSIDIRVQHALRDEIAQAMKTYSAIGGAGIVLDVRTGEVAALVSLPDFEPLERGTAPADSRFNRMTLGVYEMGSTFKTFALAMALDAGTVGLNGGYDASHPIKISRFTISDDHPKNRWLSTAEIYQYSSNIGAAKMAVDVGPAGQRAFMDRMGMLRRAAIELPEIGAPLYPRRWGTIETMTIAYGHGISVSPLQTASGIAAVVNGGLLMPATLLRREAGEPVPVQRVLKPRTSDIMRRLMRLVVAEGTGTRADAQGYMVGGKTGTAEKAGAGGYKRKSLLTSFVSAFPMHDPRYVVIAILDEPKGTKETHGFATAGWNAAPTVGKIIPRIAPILGVVPVASDAPGVREALMLPPPVPASQERKVASF